MITNSVRFCRLHMGTARVDLLLVSQGDTTCVPKHLQPVASV